MKTVDDETTEYNNGSLPDAVYAQNQNMRYIYITYSLNYELTDLWDLFEFMVFFLYTA